jgi:hypothetical protein
MVVTDERAKFARRGLRDRGSTIAALRAALEAAGVVFLPENGNGPGVALRKAECPKE